MKSNFLSCVINRSNILLREQSVCVSILNSSCSAQSACCRLCSRTLRNLYVDQLSRESMRRITPSSREGKMQTTSLSEKSAGVYNLIYRFLKVDMFSSYCRLANTNNPIDSSLSYGLDWGNYLKRFYDFLCWETVTSALGSELSLDALTHTGRNGLRTWHKKKIWKP